MIKSIEINGRTDIKKVTINGGVLFEKATGPSFRHIQVGDDLSGKTLYIGTWDGSQWLSRGFPSDAESQVELSPGSIITMDVDPAEQGTHVNAIRQVVSGSAPNRRTYGAVRVNGAAVNIYDKREGQTPTINYTEYVLPDFQGTDSVVTVINTAADLYQYFWIEA